ncbi:chromate efflux transporter [Stutzerimonas xanthomarina]|uniref:Chromate transporter n=2 Tax=Stutzerimonas xanthomarina TaxID=271420 RepID=A0A1M5RVC7_9GAMM|nr:chromate efflux transporter [Stutzerimonas xanthomarina]MCP9339315.1 chromate efflux transporter [Stutzerimonas xanthomarina]SEH93921.1 chromate transporter [Stutzerimonas xanthomarina]SHH29793.1 chromate transporter [Stutzerimonas xanthomarina DSM 18231]
MSSDQLHSNAPEHSNPWSIFLLFLRLGLTSFGGPVAHLGYFRDEFVHRRRWLDEQGYADLVALCQFLPGPASSQVGIAIGLLRGGYCGSLAAWTGFTLPSAIALALFALGIGRWGGSLPDGVLHGLKIVAVAVVAQAVWGMARNLCTNGPRIAIALLAACAVLLLTSAWAQLVVIAIAGLTGLLLFRPAAKPSLTPFQPRVRQTVGVLALLLFFALLLLLPALAAVSTNQLVAMVDSFYRAGALVFGGGHVVLPLLQAEVVPNGWVSNDTFMAGYGAAQAVPGPLFTFSAFLGASISSGSSLINAALCLIAVFIPSFLLVFGAMPFWDRLRANRRMQAALGGVNAAVVGLLLAALYDPVWTSAIFGPGDFLLAAIALAALMVWKSPPWLVVMAGGIAGWLLAMLS